MLVGVTSRNCGGAERFFSDLFYRYNASAETRHELFFFTDPSTLDVLKSLGKLREGKGVLLLRNFSNRFKRILENADVLWKILRYRIRLIHVTNYGRNYYDRLYFLSRLPAFIRPKLVINIVDCEIPYVLKDPAHEKHESYRQRYLPMFSNIRPDGVFTWYRLFCEFAKEQHLLRSGAALEAAETRFADTAGFVPSPEKKKEIVFASRLTPQKQPLMFVQAVAILRKRFPELAEGWKFFIYGSGPCEEEVKEAIRSYQLETVLTHFPSSDLRTVFSGSSCFVSTQDYENFPSLSMNEAMAAGNALVARNVGQTSLFLEDGKNGYLAATDDAAGIAGALASYLGNPAVHADFARHSLYLAHEVHTPANFIRQADAFWEKVLGQP